ncbi:hypothetical protein [Nostoc foliaceum]|uniref:Transposase n=1 Tax=Nostoc linckia FACHB-391 TaxID=2692906 RepID=A0ABR8FA78_NOSLI|nr:hypothetical protein [Nostoc foliaceum]MBD2565541.1 hypothetical protein [Nostoc linckia FACHB-391]
MRYLLYERLRQRWATPTPVEHHPINKLNPASFSIIKPNVSRLKAGKTVTAKIIICRRCIADILFNPIQETEYCGIN